MDPYPGFLNNLEKSDKNPLKISPMSSESPSSLYEIKLDISVYGRNVTDIM